MASMKCPLQTGLTILSPSRYKLLSTSTDNNVSVWDVLTGECEQRYHFSSPILRAQFHPRDKMVLTPIYTYRDYFKAFDWLIVSEFYSIEIRRFPYLYFIHSPIRTL